MKYLPISSRSHLALLALVSGFVAVVPAAEPSGSLEPVIIHLDYTVAHEFSGFHLMESQRELYEDMIQSYQGHLEAGHEELEEWKREAIRAQSEHLLGRFRSSLDVLPDSLECLRRASDLSGRLTVSLDAEADVIRLVHLVDTHPDFAEEHCPGGDDSFIRINWQGNMHRVVTPEFSARFRETANDIFFYPSPEGAVAMETWRVLGDLPPKLRTYTPKQSDNDLVQVYEWSEGPLKLVVMVGADDGKLLSMETFFGRRLVQEYIFQDYVEHEGQLIPSLRIENDYDENTGDLVKGLVYSLIDMHSEQRTEQAAAALIDFPTNNETQIDGMAMPSSPRN